MRRVRFVTESVNNQYLDPLNFGGYTIGNSAAITQIRNQFTAVSLEQVTVNDGISVRHRQRRYWPADGG